MTTYQNYDGIDPILVISFNASIFCTDVSLLSCKYFFFFYLFIKFSKYTF